MRGRRTARQRQGWPRGAVQRVDEARWPHPLRRRVQFLGVWPLVWAHRRHSHQRRAASFLTQTTYNAKELFLQLDTTDIHKQADLLGVSDADL